MVSGQDGTVLVRVVEDSSDGTGFNSVVFSPRAMESFRMVEGSSDGTGFNSVVFSPRAMKSFRMVEGSSDGTGVIRVASGNSATEAARLLGLLGSKDVTGFVRAGRVSADSQDGAGAVKVVSMFGSGSDTTGVVGAVRAC
jgi:hypothetical protein